MVIATFPLIFYAKIFASDIQDTEYDQYALCDIIKYLVVASAVRKSSGCLIPPQLHGINYNLIK